MKNKKGFILSTYVYILLVFFLLLLGTMLAVLNNTRLLSNKLKEQSSNTSGLVNKDFSFVLLGDKETIIRKGEEFIDPGYIIKSSGGNDLSDIVKVTGSVNSDTLGIYELTYTATYNGVTKTISRNVEVVIPGPVSFEEDSWETIKAAVSSGNTDNYNVGDTKTVDLGSLGTHTVRIANKTACDGTLESETACGFVIEFADVITTHVMNSTDTNAGGWPASELRTYVNDTVYNALPTELKSGIIDTYVVSGHGSEDSSNFTSTDKLYLLSTREVWGKEGTSNQVNYDSADGDTITRQLDWYSTNGVTTSNYSGAIKQYSGTNSWWLRSADYDFSDDFCYVVANGAWGSYSANYSHGVSAAFRLG